jgi:hypothetical protein
VRIDLHRAIKSGCVVAIIVGIPIVGITLFGNFIDQCGDPGWGECVPTPWTDLFIAIAISVAVGSLVSLALIAAGAIRTWRG